MALGKARFAFRALILAVISGTSASDTPFCERCPCNSPPNSAPNVNCDLVPLGPDLYNESLWIDGYNQSYPIETLSLQFNGLRALETPFPASDLTALDLGNNLIAQLGTALFANLQSMRTLVLARNRIDRIDPDVFRGEYVEDRYFPLIAMKTLDLSHNDIHTLDADVFEHIDELETLVLSHNPIRAIDAQTLTAVASLVFLKELDLSSAHLKDLPDHFMHTPKLLSALDLSWNEFRGVPPALGESHSLQTLILDGNPIANLTDQNGLPTIPTLKALHMSYMPELETIGESSVADVPALEELRVSHNPRLVSIDGNALRARLGNRTGPEGLTKLLLANNSLAYLDRNLTGNWARLQQLELALNPWSCDCGNQWIVDELVPLYSALGNGRANELICRSPIEMQNVTLSSLSERRSRMRCLDLYGHRPELDAFVLIGTLSGLLTLLLALSFVVHVYRARRFHHGIFHRFVTGRPYYSRV